VDNDLKMLLKKHLPFPTAMASAYRLGKSLTLAGPRHQAGRRLLQTIRPMSPDRPRIWFFGVPTHNNLGDLAQWISIRDWLTANYPAHEIVEVTSDAFHGATAAICAELTRLVDPQSDLIVMQSGYTMDGLHPDELAHTRVPALLPHVRTVFFPQTILYRSRAGLNRIQSTLRSSPRVLLLARDPHSLELAEQLFPDTTKALFPDIVTTLIGTFDSSPNRSGLLLCARNDGEKLYTAAEFATLAQKLEALGPLTITDTSTNLRPEEFTPAAVRRELEEVVRSYSQYRVIVTDRYHGTIFAVASGTPVIVLQTTDHKVTSGAQWLSKYYPSHVQIAGSIADAVAAVRGALALDRYHQPGPWPENHYSSQLRSMIDSI